MLARYGAIARGGRGEPASAAAGGLARGRFGGLSDLLRADRLGGGGGGLALGGLAGGGRGLRLFLGPVALPADLDLLGDRVRLNELRGLVQHPKVGAEVLAVD